MKQLLSISIIVVLLVGCRSTKKLTESSAVISNQTEVIKKADVKEETKVNNDKSTYKKTMIIETVYDTKSNPSDPSRPETKPSESKKKDSPVLSTKVTVIEEGTKDNSNIETNKSDNSETTTKTSDKSKTEISTVYKKSVPIPWGWIFACSALVVGVFIYFSKSKIAVIIKAFIKKLFV